MLISINGHCYHRPGRLEVPAEGHRKHLSFRMAECILVLQRFPAFIMALPGSWSHQRDSQNTKRDPGVDRNKEKCGRPGAREGAESETAVALRASVQP